jgi:hypothetical protein
LFNPNLLDNIIYAAVTLKTYYDESLIVDSIDIPTPEITIPVFN